MDTSQTVTTTRAPVVLEKDKTRNTHDELVPDGKNRRCQSREHKQWSCHVARPLWFRSRTCIIVCYHFFIFYLYYCYISAMSFVRVFLLTYVLYRYLRCFYLSFLYVCNLQFKRGSLFVLYPYSHFVYIFIETQTQSGQPKGSVNYSIIHETKKLKKERKKKLCFTQTQKALKSKKKSLTHSSDSQSPQAALTLLPRNTSSQKMVLRGESIMKQCVP